MIDLHCHILPGIDDGPETIDEAVDMCRIASADGIKTIVATPHFNPGIYENSSEKVFSLIDKLGAKAKEKGIDVRILPGADIAVTPELPAYLKKEEYLTINRTGRYFLAEFPAASAPPGWDMFLLSFLNSGTIPVITHPERNSWFLEHPDALYDVVKKGVMVQVTAMSITGDLGEDIQEFSIYLLKHNLVHVIASDAHSAAYRLPLLSHAVRMAGDVIGKEKAYSLVTSIPAAIIEGRHVSLPGIIKPVRQKKRWLQRAAIF
jgi:protein-tyrosine phosphatase